MCRAVSPVGREEPKAYFLMMTPASGVNDASISEPTSISYVPGRKGTERLKGFVWFEPGISA